MTATAFSSSTEYEIDEGRLLRTAVDLMEPPQLLVMPELNRNPKRVRNGESAQDAHRASSHHAVREGHRRCPAHLRHPSDLHESHMADGLRIFAGFDHLTAATVRITNSVLRLSKMGARRQHNDEMCEATFGFKPEEVLAWKAAKII